MKAKLDKRTPLDANYEIKTVSDTAKFLKMDKRRIKQQEKQLNQPDWQRLENLDADIYIYVVKLKSGHCNHEVTFFNGMLYGSSDPQALAITRDNLDMLCGGPGEFKGMECARAIQPKEYNKPSV